MEAGGQIVLSFFARNCSMRFSFSLGRIIYESGVMLKCDLRSGVTQGLSDLDGLQPVLKAKGREMCVATGKRRCRTPALFNAVRHSCLFRMMDNTIMVLPECVPRGDWDNLTSG
jgi:hypothetical protein